MIMMGHGEIECDDYYICFISIICVQGRGLVDLIWFRGRKPLLHGTARQKDVFVFSSVPPIT